MFDPFTATLAEAQAQPDASASPGGAVTRWAAAQRLLADRVHFETNALDGMAICARAGLVAPDWLARAFLQGYDRVLNGHARSWDEAFGASLRKGVNVASLRNRRTARMRVACIVGEFIHAHPDIPLSGLFAAASDRGKIAADDRVLPFARRLGVGRTEAESLYRQAVRLGWLHDADDIRQALGHPSLARNRPAKFQKAAGLKKRL
ncbi:MAG: hypothetical protein ACTHL8_01075 [Burkholderiaceae bacterium]